MTARTLRLMAILAHPDDESLGLGGVLAKYASEGVHVSLVTATRGEGGRYGVHRAGPEHPGPERLGQIREAELRAAAAVLGVRDLELLGYHDGRLAHADAGEALQRIVTHVRRLRPDVAVTFAHDGAYGHPDHVAISQLATASMVAAADPGHAAPGAPHAVAKLYYFVNNQEEWESYQTAFKKLVSVVDGVERHAAPWPEWSITTVVDTRAHWRTAWKAISCHASQIEGYQGLRDLPPERHEALWGARRFYRAYSTVNGGPGRENDLFEGLRTPD